MKRLLLATLLLMISGCNYSTILNKSEDQAKTIRYIDFIEAVQEKEISRVLINPNDATAQVVGEDGVRYEVNLAQDKNLLKILTENNVDIAVLPAYTSEVVYETRELAWNACRSWMNEGGEFYIQEGSDYNMVTWSFPRRRCFYSEDKMEVLGKELIQIKEEDKFLAENFPDIGIGIATPVTQKTFKFQEPIP